MLDRPSLPISEIVQIAANSALARVSWDGGRGRAPLGYIKGMAVMFAVALRKLAQGDPAAVEMARASSGDPSRDALAYYASEFARLGMRNDVSGIDTLRAPVRADDRPGHARIVGPLLRRPRPVRQQHFG